MSDYVPPSRFMLDVVREHTEGRVQEWNADFERWTEEHGGTTPDEFAASFLRERRLTLPGEAADPRWAEFYRGWP